MGEPVKVRKARLSKRAVIVIVASQLVLVGIIGGIVVANAVNGSAPTLVSRSSTPQPEITGALLVPKATPTTVPVAAETAAPDPAPQPYVPVPNQVNSTVCKDAMDAINATVGAFYDTSNTLYTQRQNFTGDGMTPEEYQAVLDDYTRQIDAVQAQIAAYFAGLGIDPSKGYGCGGDSLPAN